jgi:hypothetical protein
MFPFNSIGTCQRSGQVVVSHNTYLNVKELSHDKEFSEQKFGYYNKITSRGASICTVLKRMEFHLLEIGKGER